MELKAGARGDANRWFNASLDARPDAGSAMTMAALMATSGFYEEALSLSERALEYLNVRSRGVRVGLKVSEADIRRFQDVVQSDIDNAAK